jgi:putative DNA primase/helicase
VIDTTRHFAVSTAGHIAAKLWSAQDPMGWGEFLDWLDIRHPAGSKDCGGYFLGSLRGRRKKAENVLSRSAITLDADKANDRVPGEVEAALGGVAMAIHSTWSHTAEAPHYRVLLPLDRDVTPAEYILVTKALLRVVGEACGDGVWDRSCTQPERMMLRPSTQDATTYYAHVAAGDPLCADDWVVRAVEWGLDRVDSTIDDHGGGVADYDPDTPPNQEQLGLAMVLLDKAEREVRTLFNETTGEPFGGRNQACISRLPMLYRFVLGGCLKEEDVDARVLAAVLTAEGSSDFDEAEYATVSANAWEYANLSGGRRPAVDEANDVFDVVEGDEPGPEWPPYRPDLYFTQRGQFQTQVTADAIRAVAPIGLDAIDNALLVYRGGVWQPGETWINAALAKMFRNEWTQTVRNTTVQFLKESPDTPRIVAEPVTAWINCQNGMLDWRTGAMVEHRADFLSTVQIPHPYEEDAECPRFLEFLERVAPDGAMEFMWELVGYMLMSGNPLQVAPMLYGPGSNGKGTFLNVLSSVLGHHNVAAVALHDLIENRFRAAELYGKLANIAGDLDDRWLSSTGLFKQVTGDDTISAERKYGAAFSFKPWAVPLFSTNTIFSVSDSSEGYARRMMVVPFPNHYDGEGRSGLFAEAELRGILRRGVEGLQTLMERGRFLMPESVAEETQKFLAGGDVVRSWVEDRCVVEVGAWTLRTELFADFESYVVFTGSKGMSNRSLYNRLEQMAGVREGKRRGERGMHGIRLNGGVE